MRQRPDLNLTPALEQELSTQLTVLYGQLIALSIQVKTLADIIGLPLANMDDESAKRSAYPPDVGADPED